MDYICRQDAIALSGLTSGTLSRLDAAGTIVPKKLGGEAHPVVLYTPQQIEELKLVADLRDRLSAVEIKRVVESSRELLCVPRCYIVLADQIYWVAKAQLGELVADLVAKDGAIAVKVVARV